MVCLSIPWCGCVLARSWQPWFGVNMSKSVLVNMLRELLALLTKPGHMYVIKVEEVPMGLKHTLAMPPLNTVDVTTKRELTLIVDGGSPIVGDVDPIDSTSKAIIVTQGAAVRLELRDTDDAGNVSEPEVLEFTAVDTVAPPAPGDLAVTNVEEVTEDGPAIV